MQRRSLRCAGNDIQQISKNKNNSRQNNASKRRSRKTKRKRTSRSGRIARVWAHNLIVGSRGQREKQRTVDVMKLKDWVPIYFESPTPALLIHFGKHYNSTTKHYKTHSTNVLPLTHVPDLLPRHPDEGPVDSTKIRLTNPHCHARDISKAEQRSTAKHNNPEYSTKSLTLPNPVRQQFVRHPNNAHVPLRIGISREFLSPIIHAVHVLPYECKSLSR